MACIYQLLELIFGLVLIPGSFAESEVIEDVLKHWNEIINSNGFSHDDFKIPAQLIPKAADLFHHEGEAWCFCGKENWLSYFKNQLNGNDACFLTQKVTDNFTKPDIATISMLSRASMCGYDCVFQRHNMIGPDGNLNPVTTKNVFMKYAFVEEGVREIGERILDKCLSGGEMVDAALSFFSVFFGGTTCNAEPYKLIVCLSNEMTESCPVNLQNTEDSECKHLYENKHIIKKLLKHVSLGLL